MLCGDDHYASLKTATFLSRSIPFSSPFLPAPVLHPLSLFFPHLFSPLSPAEYQVTSVEIESAGTAWQTLRRKYEQDIARLEDEVVSAAQVVELYRAEASVISRLLIEGRP